MAWILLLVAGLLEVGWAIGLKYSQGFSRPGPSIATLLAMIASMWLLALAARELPIGTAYAVWTGIGAVGAAILGMVLFHEPRDATRLACVGLIVLGIIGLKWTARPAAKTGASVRESVEDNVAGQAARVVLDESATIVADVAVDAAAQRRRAVDEHDTPAQG